MNENQNRELYYSKRNEIVYKLRLTDTAQTPKSNIC